MAIDDFLQEEKPRFSPLVETELRDAGWYPERRVESSLMEQWCYLKIDFVPGCLSISPKVFRFLEEFGGLHIYQSGIGVNYRREPLGFEPKQGRGTAELNEWFWFEFTLDDPLFPIGIAGDEKDTLLLMGASGRVYATNAAGFLLYGQTPEQALETLVHGIAVEILDVSLGAAENDRRAAIVTAARETSQT